MAAKTIGPDRESYVAALDTSGRRKSKSEQKRLWGI